MVRYLVIIVSLLTSAATASAECARHLITQEERV